MKFLTVTIISALTLGLQAAEESKKQEKPKVDYTKIKFPMGFAHSKGKVISPFRPYNILDVSHLRPGDLARDPFTAKVNPKTGKADISTAKIFRVPQPKPATATAAR